MHILEFKDLVFSLMRMNMNKNNTPKYLKDHMVWDTYCQIKLLKYFKSTFKVSNTCEQTINNVSGNKDSFAPIFF